MRSVPPPVTEKLPCKLSLGEKALKSDELSREVLNHKRLELEKSLATQALAKKLKDSDRRIGDLAEEVRTGIEIREVPVVERRDYANRRVLIIRTDTHDVVSERPMQGNERQADLWSEPLGPKDAPADDDSDDDDDDADVNSH